jgi:hypothetical protein
MRSPISERDRASVDALLGRTVADSEVLTAVMVEAIAELSRRVMDLECGR